MELITAIICPTVGLVWFGEYDSIFEEPLATIIFLGPALFYLATIIMATTIAYRLNFSKQPLSVVRSPWSAFWGCLFFWVYCFPYFLHNWKLVSENRAAQSFNGKSSSCGLILMAVMWNLFWLYPISQITPEGPRRSRRYNSIVQVSLSEYHRAQGTFKSRDFAKSINLPSNNKGYCDNFRNLYYGLDDQEQRLGLISKDMADAFAGQTNGATTQGKENDKSLPYKGYIFLEDPYVVENKLWDEQFALVAYPRSYTYGTNIWWIGKNGNLLRLSVEHGQEPGLLTPEQSPLHPKCKVRWF